VIRGASWGRPPNDLRAAKRVGMAPDTRGVTNGIRLVREL
jgi:formylglycine-generating enzyme required for sulfatase activity